MREKRQNQHENISSKNTQQKNRKNCKNVTKTSKKKMIQEIYKKNTYIHMCLNTKKNRKLYKSNNTTTTTTE